jgi:hypothetical protein
MVLDCPLEITTKANLLEITKIHVGGYDMAPTPGKSKKGGVFALLRVCVETNPQLSI